MPTGAIGVALKEYMPFIASKAERFGLVVHGRIMFRVISHCSNILHQFDIRKFAGVAALIASNWFFQIRMQRSAVLVRCMSAGVYWIKACCSVMKFSTSLDVSLSNL